ncbi:hypothetical protein KDAU_04130 [Dictyobacter aurantiacus]|uniref:Uncharacterized protein n=1 Tax=Dictyobacter aurantiacus TaxID=1936993 RepID=A0A401Z8A0_9CHLR|nr:hypothetical protein KDAU_04130 [Dictyobacter aurantiacus]
MAAECVETLAAGDVPQTYCLVIASAGKGFTIRAEGHRFDLVNVVVECVETLPAGNIPQTYCLIIASAGKGFAIRAEGHRANPVSMSS